MPIDPLGPSRLCVNLEGAEKTVDLPGGGPKRIPVSQPKLLENRRALSQDTRRWREEEGKGWYALHLAQPRQKEQELRYLVSSNANSASGQEQAQFYRRKVLQPAEGEPHREQWVTCNSMLLSWIFNHLDEELHNSVAGARNAKTLWDDLKEQFSQEENTNLEAVRSALLRSEWPFSGHLLPAEWVSGFRPEKSEGIRCWWLSAGREELNIFSLDSAEQTRRRRRRRSQVFIFRRPG
ncbi:hypothetical protein CRG98_033335 [Punica granatum]|uniref:Retrotransposon Copia-like N-terminal domain-containing protein n=1 Tax=Punica granatum TaxID=22663 RepID=A0A2I0IQJ1_PUNGR|nr:hypothetical protein CRG98_033335 [Punica granatum]